MYWKKCIAQFHDDNISFVILPYIKILQVKLRGSLLPSLQNIIYLLTIYTRELKSKKRLKEI